ncbi:MAG: pirin family protein [Steroidobacteraceae bacterium]
MAVARVLSARMRDLGGGMMVRRLLPSPAQQGVGPFVFFDHFGPIEVTPESNFDVRPHPHIGLATVTYLFEGAMVHRDSLGRTQRIEPGAINWMTAGRGIVHSERRPEDLSTRVYSSHGLQLWTALPTDYEEVEPVFIHTPAHDIPSLEQGGVSLRVLIGSAFGSTSPVATFAETLYLDVSARRGSFLALEPANIERAVYSVDKDIIIDDLVVERGHMAVLAPGAVGITAPDGARYVVIGGALLDGHRHIWWNFVSSRKERIEQAKSDWTAQRMGVIPGETEWIPLPE